MAVAEARAAWQRAANRCFFQEDAKRAPKLACCQSSSSASKQVDTGPTNNTDGQYHPASIFMPKRNPSFSNLPQTQDVGSNCNLAMQTKRASYEQSVALEAKVVTLGAGTVNSTAKLDEVHPQKGDIINDNDDKNCESSLDRQYGLPDVRMNKAVEARKEEVNASYCKNAEEYCELMEVRERYEHLDVDPDGCPVSKQANECSLNPESPWIGDYKRGPWWQTTDKEELAFLVEKKSLNHIENCDLPPPQKIYVGKHPYVHSGCIDHDEALLSYSDLKARTGSISNRTHAQGFPDSRKADRNEVASSEEGCSQYGSDKSFRYKLDYHHFHSGMKSSLSFISLLFADISNCLMLILLVKLLHVCGCVLKFLYTISRFCSVLQFNSSYGTNYKDITKTLQVSEGGPEKALLMEALCHSQTRAREAEKAAKQADAEKEHILKLFFRQASQLFAYKQWFQLLQLEIRYIQIKNTDQSISTLFPVVLPKMAYKGRKQQKNWQKATKRRRVQRGRPRHDIKRYAAVFALGMSLVGAGMLLGWTVGWMLPPF
ncbi:LOW QUALITY PROTEIN: uncharacterized protein LOC121234451 [Juglans microcarpa x Juglans regia]|uniref:LOW QUALITY PROTEIN: uncharacterized protein LOC121234451 n=1 Tax=Juglans microcarpa x Juglans regia TaxID=2249226 RepID=UPI001B7E46E8|nr:LOW QUALITY PROTEIN: uncharacterized protein LOC121234451 [Juglans microcarpa x Juglans regia]